MNRKNTKRALLSSVLALILCVSMLVGTTYAWLTDSVTSGKNQIIAGNLDVELYNSIGIDENAKVDGMTDLFGEIELWEPGVVAYENLTVANVGNLALKYQLAINFDNATKTPEGKTLADILQVGVVPGGISTTDRAEAVKAVGEDWTSLKSFVEAGTLLEKGVAETYGIVIYWQPGDNDNEFNMNNGIETVLSIDLGVKLVATQKDFEEDSFGNDYDEGLVADATYVWTLDSLKTALENGEKAILADDITITSELADTTSASVPVGLYIDQDGVLDLNGHTIAMNDVGGTGAVIMAYNANLTIEGEGTIAYNGESGFAVWARNSSDAVGKGVVNIYDATIYGEGAEVTLLYADCNVYGNGADFENYASINVYGGNFVKADKSSTNPQDYMNVKNHGAGRITMYGGTYNWDLSWMGTVWPGTDDKAYITVAEGYESVEFNGLYYVVPENTKVVGTAADLQSALTAGGDIVLGADVAMTGSTTITTDFVLDGNGHTITMTEGAFNPIALFDIRGCNATIKNATFDGIKDGAVIRTVDAKLLVDNVTVQNSVHTVGEGLLRLRGENTIQNSTFKNNNCTIVITLNFDGLNPNLPQTVDNCVFENNTCNSTAVVYYVKGSGATISDNDFVGNTVNCDTNGATVYMGFQENTEVTGNLFKNNTVTDASTSTRVAGGIFFGYETVFENNAFIGNKASNANGDALGNDVCVSVYYTDIDLSGNYWNGVAPVEGVNYYVQHKTSGNSLILNDYLTTYGN